MDFRYVVLGAGRQGVAVAHDLAGQGEADTITLLDLNRAQAQAGVERVQKLAPDRTCDLIAGECDVTKPVEIASALANADVVIVTTPFVYNVTLTDVAIASGTSLCDLGGNTTTVRAQLLRNRTAERAGVSIIPDCGLAPGMSNILAAHGVSELDEPQHVRIRCGGLPEKPVGPLGYKLVFNFDGLINEYSGKAEYLRDGKKVAIPTLTEIETLEFEQLGTCEAAVTSGGTSTCPDTYNGRLQTYEYKTVRYPGHFATVRALFELGFFDEQSPDADLPVVPKVLSQRLLEQRLAFPEMTDVVVLRVEVSGQHQGAAVTRRYDVFAKHDPTTGFTAMEQTTAYPTALVAYLQARGSVSPGAQPPETAVPLSEFVSEISEHGVEVSQSESPATR